MHGTPLNCVHVIYTSLSTLWISASCLHKFPHPQLWMGSWASGPLSYTSVQNYRVLVSQLPHPIAEPAAVGNTLATTFKSAIEPSFV